MKAIAIRQGCNEPEQIEIGMPEAMPNRVLVRTVALGICGTDRDILASGEPRTPPGEAYLILGHEAVGQVVTVGGGVGGFDLGDFVVPSVRRRRSDVLKPYRLDLAAWDEFTERGIYYQHGFSAQYWLESPDDLYRVPPGLEPFAMLTEPFSVSEKAFNEAIQIQHARIGVDGFRHRNPRVLITGLGPIGFTAALISLAHGFDTTIAGRRDEKDYQVQFAHSLGVDYLDSRKVDFKDFQSRDKNFDLIIECTGNDQLTYA
ncbi:alcohol dehydrogenase catalytic domain-containing protein, partial [Candidatus Poribacteria bacterium]|nr:alcohol dehydrogenase catalytic domain-containing protein [Candidatus Poribacteria bacterium]